MDDVFAAAFAITHGSGGSLSGEVEGLPKGMQETENSAAAGSGTQPTAKNKHGPQPTVEPPRKNVKVAEPEKLPVRRPFEDRMLMCTFVHGQCVSLWPLYQIPGLGIGDDDFIKVWDREEWFMNAVMGARKGCLKIKGPLIQCRTAKELANNICAAMTKILSEKIAQARSQHEAKHEPLLLVPLTFGTCTLLVYTKNIRKAFFIKVTDGVREWIRSFLAAAVADALGSQPTGEESPIEKKGGFAMKQDQRGGYRGKISWSPTEWAWQVRAKSTAGRRTVAKWLKEHGLSLHVPRGLEKDAFEHAREQKLELAIECWNAVDDSKRRRIRPAANMTLPSIKLTVNGLEDSDREEGEEGGEEEVDSAADGDASVEHDDDV